MNDDVTNGQRAAVAMDAIGTYALFEHPMEFRFFLEEEGEVDLEVAKGRLGDLLCGLMHYAELRKISFDDVLIMSQHKYDQQHTSYVLGDAVQIVPGARPAGPADVRIGEVLKARPGNPPAYLVDFIAYRAWYHEPDLAPAEHFPAIKTRYGDIRTAYAAQHCLNQTVRRIQDADNQGDRREAAVINDLRTFLSTLSGWAGIPLPVLLRFRGLEHLTVSGLVPPTAVPGTDPARLAATDMATPLDTGVREISHHDRRRAPARPIVPATRARRGGSR